MSETGLFSARELYRWRIEQSDEVRERVTFLMDEVMRLGNERDAAKEEFARATAAIDDAVHGGSMEHIGLAHVVAQALSDAARAVDAAHMERDRAYDALAAGLGLSEEHEARESLDALVKCALESIRHIEGANDELLKQLTAEQARGDNLSAEVRSLHRELAAAESKHTKAVLDGGKVMDALVRRAHEIMTERDEALAMAEAAMREGLSECERLREKLIVSNAAGKFLDHHAKGVRSELREARDRLRVAEETIEELQRALSLSDSSSQAWTPATVCEACKGDEISGCICGMVPGTEPRKRLEEPTRAEMELALGEGDEAFLNGWTIRRCIDCNAPVAGGPTRCVPCATGARAK